MENVLFCNDGAYGCLSFNSKINQKYREYYMQSNNIKETDTCSNENKNCW